MKKNSVINLTFLLVVVFLFAFKVNLYAQGTTANTAKIDFWNAVQIGGGIGVSVGSGAADIMVAPSAIYNFNEYVSAGLGVHYSYVKQRDFYRANTYGVSVLTLFNPIEELQISTELEQVNVNRTIRDSFGTNAQHFWNTALFFGLGYRNQNVTLGMRYNILHKDRNAVYSEAFMPFVRVYF